MKTERAERHMGAAGCNHNAGGFKETGYVILLSFLPKRAEAEKKG